MKQRKAISRTLLSSRIYAISRISDDSCGLDAVAQNKTAGVVDNSLTLYIFYWIKVFLKLLFAATISDLHKYIYLCKSLRIDQTSTSKTTMLLCI